MFSLMFAVNSAPFTTLVIGLWPEYDHPGVLITYEIVSDQAQLPYEFGVYLPDNASMALHSRDTDEGEKELVVQEITTGEQGSLMKLNVDQPQYYAQLYYNPFDSTAHRQFDIDLKFDQNIDSAFVVIQQNLSAENFNTNLTNVESMTDEYGFIYHRQAIVDLPAEDVFHVKFSYENPEHLNSLDIIKERAAEQPPVDQDSSAVSTVDDGSSNVESGMRRGRYMIFFGLPLVLILFYFFRKNLSRNSSTKSSVSTDRRFCPECGTESEPNAQYCNNCGKELNVP